ncbi:MAG: ferrochelatase, partial [Gammaproteobacteria bacterium]|nr:ferrochelatase [Gammaproteobacteria bacterium]
MSGRTVVLLVNLGTPDDPTAGAIRKYLKEFLSDRRVIGTNRFLWWFVLRLAILPRRPAQLVSAYQTIWREDSPIRTTASDLVNRLRERLVVMDKKDVPLVEFAMTYGMPSVSEALERLSHEAVERIVVIPLFPQYSKTTTEAVNDRVSPAINRHPNRPALLFSKDYHDHPLYIDAIADSVAKRWQRTGRPEKLLISFHGLPIAQSEGDPYAIQCKRSAELIARALDLPDDDWR